MKLAQRDHFKREIVIVLVVKLILILCLKYAFFNDPVSKHLTTDDVSAAFLGRSQVTSQATSTDYSTQRSP